MTDPNDLRPRALPVDPAPGPGRQASLAVVTIVHGPPRAPRAPALGPAPAAPPPGHARRRRDGRLARSGTSHAGTPATGTCTWPRCGVAAATCPWPPPATSASTWPLRRGADAGRAARRRLHPFPRAARAVCRRARLRGEPRPRRAARRRPRGPVVLAGEVAYLPPAPARPRLPRPRAGSPGRARSTAPGASRPGPRRGAHGRRPAPLLVAVLRAHRALLAGHRGFDEAYVGYGGEDTDFGQRLGAAGGRLLWVGGARAHHQHHPTASPPVQHVHDIVANANRFAGRWGWWPMEGWLDAFAEMGLAERVDGAWHVITEDARPRSWRMPSRRRLAQLRTK